MAAPGVLASETTSPPVGSQHARTAVAGATVLVSGLAAATLAQGGYYTAGRLPLLLSLPAALVLVAMAAPDRLARVPRAPVLAVLAMAAWAVARGAVTADPLSGSGMGGLLVAVAVVLVVVSTAPDEAREIVVQGLLGLGVLVALAGWVGVVWHLAPLAVTQDGMWRAGSTLTYPNAAAAVLTPLLLLALARLSEERADLGLVLTTTALLAGLAATLSRAGALSLAVGLVVLAVLLGWRPLARAAVAPVLGTAVVLAGLLPSMPLTAAPGRWPALAAAAGGVVLAAAVGRRTDRLPATFALAGLAAALAAAALASALVVDPETVRQRLDAGSSTRVAAHRAAIRLLADQPVVGIGPGHGSVDVSAVGQPGMAIRYVHDEYVQVLLDLGAVGLLLLAVLVVALADGLHRARRAGHRGALLAGAAAALAAAAVHGGLDFVWHIPVVPLTVVALVAAAGSGKEPQRGLRHEISPS
ncbi:MAG TPA: O-antigen ligase family protein [Actinomycetes bacterium]